MAGFSFGKRPKPRRFDYIPRYYDAAKEDLHSRLSQTGGEMTKEDLAKARIKTGLRNKYQGDKAYRSKEVNKSNFRLLYIIIFLVFVTYMILKSDRIIKLIEAIG